MIFPRTPQCRCERAEYEPRSRRFVQGIEHIGSMGTENRESRRCEWKGHPL
jgi:hypothetical protein